MSIQNLLENKECIILKELVDTNLLVTDVNKSIDLQMMFETPGQKMLTGDC